MHSDGRIAGKLNYALAPIQDVQPRRQDRRVSLVTVLRLRTLTPLLIASAAMLASCGSANAQPESARPIAALKPTPTTAADRIAAKEFAKVDWSNVRYPSLSPHCHVSQGSKIVEKGSVLGYVLTPSTPIALLTAACGVNDAALPNGIWAFEPPAGSTSVQPRLLETLVKLPPSPFQHDSPTSALYFANLLPGDQQARAVPSAPGTTSKSSYTAAGPVLSTVDCYTQGPQFVHGTAFTVVGLTGIDYSVPDQPPAAMESLEFTYRNGTIHLHRRFIAAVARYSCP
jgi:hypothetical protein